MLFNSFRLVPDVMKLRYSLSCFVLALLLLVYFQSVFFDDKIFAERDLPVFFYPNIVFWLQSIRSGELPLWNPYIMCGEPCLANVQPGFLYPLSILYILLPTDTAFNLSIVVHFFLAGVFTFILMKELEASDQGAALASLLFVFGGYLLSVQNVLSTLLSATWFPLTLALFLRGIRRGLWRYALATAVVLYCMFSAGGMEIFIMTAVVLFCAAWIPALYSRTASALPVSARLLYCGIAFCCFAVIGAIQILPFLELLGQSVRSNGMRFEDAVTWSLMPRNILYLFTPDVFWRGQQYYWQDQSWLKTIYTGTIPFMLSLFFFLKESAPRKIFVAAFVAGALILALGNATPLYKMLFEWVPLLKTIRYPVKFFFLVIFFLSVTAGLGWDCFRQSLDERQTQRVTFGLFFLFGFVLSLVVLALYLNPDIFWDKLSGKNFFKQSALPQQAIMHNILRCMLFTILGACTLYLMMRKKKCRSLGWYGIAGLLLLDLFAGNYGFYVAVKRETLHGTTGNMEIILNDSELCRFFVPWEIIRSDVSFTSYDNLLWQHKDFLVGNTLVEHKRFSTFGFPVLMLQHYYNLFAVPYNTPLPDATALLNMLNVKYVLWHTELNRPGYELVRKDRFYLYRNNHRLPRAVLVPNYRVTTSGKELYDRLTSPSFNPEQIVFLDAEPDVSLQQPSEGSAPLSQNLNNTVSITTYRNNTITLEATCSRNQILFLSETFYPGWKAYVDGRLTRIHRANYAFRAIALTPGHHTVRFVYDPLWFKIGAWISLAGIVGIGSAVLFACSRKKEGRICRR